MQTQIRQVLEASHLFTGLGRDLIGQIEASATRRTLGRDEILFQKGDPADSLWGVLSGRVVVEVRTEDGKEMVLDAFEEGEVFGEVGVLDFGPRRVEAKATQESELFRLERKHFLKHLQASPELCFRVFSLLCSHLRETTENLEDTALYKLPNRLAKRLTLLAAESAGDGDTVLHIMQSDLAAMLGVNREAVNRNLRAFEKEGLITLQRQRIEIGDREALAELASPWQAQRHHQWGNGNLDALNPDAFTIAKAREAAATESEPRSAGLLAVDAAEYSRALMTDAAGTLKRIKAGLDAVDRAIELYQGHTIWHAGDRVLAEFPDARTAMQAALAIQEQVDPAKRAGKCQQESLFRIGVHHGEVLARDQRFWGDTINVAVRLTQLSGAGGIAISGAVRDTLEDTEQLQLRFLGHHELQNVPEAVPVYAARAIPLLKLLVLRAETLLPRRFRPAAIVAAVVALLAGIWFVGDRMGRQSAPLAVSQLSIAVLPFANVGHAALDYLAEGIPEDVRAALSMIPGMRVIGRESSAHFSEHPASAEEIGRALAVAWLLHGSLEGADDGVYATAQLLNASNGEVVWEEEFRGAEGNPAEVGPDIARRVAVSLGIVGDDETSLPQLLPLTRDPDAHVLYLEAQSHIWGNRQRDTIDAVPLLQLAVELDPSFAEAHAVLAGLYSELPLLDSESCPRPCPVDPAGEPFTPGSRRELARRSLQTALSLKPDSPLVLGEASKARRREHDLDGALALAERALRIDPNNTAALWALHAVQWSQNDWDGRLQTSEQLIRLEPASIPAMGYHFGNLRNANRDQEALAIAERTLALYPDSEVPNFHAMIARTKLAVGDRVGAIESSLKAMPGGFFHLWFGLEHDPELFFDPVDPLRSVITLVYVGDYDRVREILVDAFDDVDPDSEFGMNSTRYLINRGELEVLAGNFDQAIEIFERARPLLKGGEEQLFWSSGHGNFDAYLSWARKSSPALALLYAYRQTGQDDKAEEIAALIRRGIAGRRQIHDSRGATGELKLLYQEAQLMAIEGPVDASLAALRRWREFDPEQFNYPRNDPFLSGLHGEPEFWEIIAELEADLAETRAQFHARQAALAKTGGG